MKSFKSGAYVSQGSAFLEGRVKDKSYILLIHLSNLELKGINK